MGKLKGILPIEGTVGSITFVKTTDGIVVREKGGITAQRLATDPRFQRTRENNAEFGNAGKAGSLLFTALRSSIRVKADSRATGRLMKRLMQALKGDTLSARGLRTVATGQPSLVEGFDFNRHAPLHGTLFAPYTAIITRSSGDFKLDVPSFIPDDAVRPPEGATHCSIGITGIEADFAGHTYVAASDASAILPLNAAPTAAFSLAVQVTPASTLPLILAVSITFYQEVNGNPYLLKNGSVNALAIVKVDV